jgi:drug/metabolite transporter (DMT)-like permease
MSGIQIIVLTVLAMVAFAANSILCRLALKDDGIDPVSFTSLRILSGSIALWLIAILRRRELSFSGDWLSAMALFTYAAAFSLAYVTLTAATGALLLFGAVQVTMIGYGFWMGERLRRLQVLGIMLAFGGLAGLLLPGLSAPPIAGAILMLCAGTSWGMYTLRGRGMGDPILTTAGNFLRASLLAAALSLAAVSWSSFDGPGVWYAVASGSLASGAGYAIWYAALRGLRVSTAATVQLSAPLIAAVGGVVFLGELPTLRLFIAAAAILGGLGLAILNKKTST